MKTEYSFLDVNLLKWIKKLHTYAGIFFWRDLTLSGSISSTLKMQWHVLALAGSRKYHASLPFPLEWTEFAPVSGHQIKRWFRRKKALLSSLISSIFSSYTKTFVQEPLKFKKWVYNVENCVTHFHKTA